MIKFTLTVLVVITVSACADALQCIVGTAYKCSANNASFANRCEELEAQNRTFAVQKCSVGQDKCLLFASKLSFEDKIDLQLVIAACGTGTLEGCNNRQELIAIDPRFGQIDQFSGSGYEYDILDICVCDTDVCVDKDQLSEYGRTIFGRSINVVAGDQLQCIVGNQYSCKAHDVTFAGDCERFEANYKAFDLQTCSAGQDKCLLFASKLSFEDKFDVQLVIAACGIGTLEGCKNRQELLAINPSFGQIDRFSGPGYVYDSLDICVCNTDVCVDEDKLTDYRKIIFGDDANCLHGHSLTIIALMVMGTFLVYY